MRETATISKGSARLLKKHAPDIVLPAMPIRILYSGSEVGYSTEIMKGEHIFKFEFRNRIDSIWPLGSTWNAYELREDFENIRTPKDALRFLNFYGIFRLRRGRRRKDCVLNWREVLGWQEIVRRLRVRDLADGFPMLGLQAPEFRTEFSEEHFVSKLGDLSDLVWNVSEDTFAWIQGIPQGLSIRRDQYLSREEIDEIFSVPGALIADSRQWHYAQSILKRRRAERAQGNSEGKQKLIAEVIPVTALDAILASVYIDRLRGIELQVCALKECNETFEKQSDNGKMYCSNYHAHLASIRRGRANTKAKKAKQLRNKEKRNESV